MNECSDAHVRWHPVIDWLKSPKTDCSNPPLPSPLSNVGPIKVQLQWSRVPLLLFFMVPHNKPAIFYQQNSSLGSVQCVDQCMRTAEVPCFGWSSATMYCAQSKHITLFLCKLYSWTESKVMIGSHFTAAVSGLIVCDVNFNCSCFVQNHRFCFLQVRCPTVFASSGHCGLLKFGLQDTSPYKVIRKCAAPIASN